MTYDFEELLKKHGSEELAEAFVFPHGLTPAEKEVADKEIKEIRMKMLNEMTPEQRIQGHLLGLRYRLEDVVKLNGKSKYQYTFLSAFKEYQQFSEKNPAVFAAEIALTTRELNQLMNGKKAPDIALFHRLEKHSDGTIPAMLWCKLVAQQWKNEIQTDHEAREREAAKVKKATQLKTKAA